MNVWLLAGGQAVQQLPAVGAPFEMQEFSDGVRVLQSLSHSSTQVCCSPAHLINQDCSELWVLLSRGCCCSRGAG